MAATTDNEAVGLYAQFKEYKNNVDDYTSDELQGILSDIEVLFKKYDRMKRVAEKTDCLNKIRLLLGEYDKINAVIEDTRFNSTNGVVDYSMLLEDEDDDPSIIWGEHGEEILEKVHRESSLRRKDNEIHKLYVELVGRWFDKWDSVSEIRKYMFRFAEGRWLEFWGETFGLQRNIDEDDESYRKRIELKFTEEFTVPEMLNHDISIFTYNFDVLQRLTSQNTYLAHKYLCHTSTANRLYIERNYVTGGEIVWF